MDSILDSVKASLQEPAAGRNTTGAVEGQVPVHDMQIDAVVYSEYQDFDEQQWDYDANDVVFDDHGEGVGIEGDLDVDDD